MREVSNALSAPSSGRLSSREIELASAANDDGAHELASFFRGLSSGLTDAAIVEGVQRFGLSRATLYRRYRQFRGDPRVSTLSNHRKPRAKVRHLAPEQNHIIDDMRKRFFKQHPAGSLVALTEVINGAMAAADLPGVSRSTVWRRWHELSAQERFSARHGTRAGREKHGLLRGHTPVRSFPLERVQIDHTLCDIELVHPATGGPIGRVWITIVLDEYSRAVLSFLLSFEAPSSATVALALARAVSPKDQWLRDLKLKMTWPFAGVPHSIYTDNGSDFCSKAMADGCAEWGIPAPEKRPRGEPQYGGIIERIIGTVMKETAMLDGAIARQINAGKDRRVPRKSTMTIDDYERHLAEWFHLYHNRKHASLDMSPAAKWAAAYNGTKALPPPRIIIDTRKFFIDFLPSTTRQLKRYGFSWDRVFYRSDNLAFFARRDADEKYILRRNPYDIRRIFVWHEEQRQHLEVMAEDPSMPSTLFYLRLAKAQNIDHGFEQTPSNIARSYDRLLEQEKFRSTKKGRKVALRNEERQRRAVNLTQHVFDEPASDEDAPKIALRVEERAPRVRTRMEIVALK